jgi:hypothetical protein
MCCATGESRRIDAGRGITLAIVILASLVWVGGCATNRAMVMPEPVPGAEDYLAAGQSAYFGANVADNRDLVSFVIGSLGADADIVIRRVDLVAGSLNISGPAVFEFSAVAFGRFPEGATRYALWRNRGFRRSVAELDSGKFVYFRQSEGPLELAVPGSGIILMSTDSVVNLASQAGTDTQSDRLDAETVRDLRSVGLRRSLGEDEGPDIMIVFPEPAAILAGPLALDIPRFPIQRLTLAAFVTEGSAEMERAAIPTAEAEDPEALPAAVANIELVGVFQFSGEIEAALFGRLGRVFILGFMRSLGLDTATLRDTVSIDVDGTALTFGGVTMSPEELVNLVIRLTGQET